jgi:Flp pilus assembly protein TadD
MRTIWLATLLTVIGVSAAARPAAAQGTWTQVTSPRFTVVSNAGEGRARDVARQFEQFRSAIELGWPWAKADLELPIVIVAARDEATMRALLPVYWERRDGTRPSSVLVSGVDRHYIVLRADIRGDDTRDMNPYITAYWSYATLTLDAAFGSRLPLWFRNGMAEVLSNTTVREKEINFGLPIPWHIRALSEPRLRLSELIALDARSPYYTSSATRPAFDAQAWAVLHYMLFGRTKERADVLNRIANLLLAGKSSTAAIEEVFGSVDALEAAFRPYSQQSVFQFARLTVDEPIAASGFSARVLGGAESAALRAALHATMNRPVEARALVAEARKLDPKSAASFEAEAWLLEREQKREEARAALAQAVELNSANAHAYFRFAILTWGTNPTADTLARIESALKRAIEIDPNHARAHALLSDAIARGDQPERAVDYAAKATTLRPREAYPRLAMARALWRVSRRDAARAQALTARQLARTDEERADAQELLAFMEKELAARPPSP